MKAMIGQTVVGEAPDDEVINIEGNWYFPPNAVAAESFTESAIQYTCPWKGDALYFDIKVDSENYRNAAWSYPSPKASAVNIVGADFGGYVAFDPRQVTIRQERVAAGRQGGR